MAQTRKKAKSGKKTYHIGWHANPKLGAYWLDYNKNDEHAETAEFALNHELAALQVSISVWNADEYQDPDQYGRGMKGTVKIEVITDDALKLEQFLLVMTNTEIYTWMRLPPHRWEADDIYAGADSNRIHRHLNVDIDDISHPCWQTAIDLMKWLLLEYRGQETIYDHCYY